MNNGVQIFLAALGAAQTVIMALGLFILSDLRARIVRLENRELR